MPAWASSTRRAWPRSTTHGVQTGGDRARKTLALHRAHLRRRPRRALRDPHALHAPGGADAGRRVERRRHRAADHAVLRDEGRPRAADRVPPARRPRGRPTRWRSRIAATRERRHADPRRDARAPRPQRLAPHAGRGEAVLEELEETARLWLMARPAPLTDRRRSTNCARISARAGELQSQGTAMPRFAANLSMLYTEHDFLDRFAAAARDGFTGGRVPVSLRARAADAGAASGRQRPAAGAVQRPARRLGRGRARHRLPAGARGRVPSRRRAGAGSTRRRWPARAFT